MAEAGMKDPLIWAIVIVAAVFFWFFRELPKTL